MKRKLDQSLIDDLNHAQNLEFVPLNDAVLSPSDLVDAEIHAKTSVQRRRAKNTDFRMLDTLKKMPGIDLSTIRELHVANHLKDPLVTKYFCDPDKTLEGLKHFGDYEPASFTWNENFRAACAILRDQLGHPSLKPIKFERGMDEKLLFTNVKASAGAIGTGGKQKNWLKIQDYIAKLLKLIQSGVDFADIWIPCIPAHRAQLKDLTVDGHFNRGYREKDRLIWVVDAATVGVEALFARPMIEYTKTAFRGYAGGKTPDELVKYITEASGNIPHWYCTDYSKFDQTIPSWLIKVCFDFVREAYEPKYKKIIDWIQYQFINTVMLLPDGSAVRVHKGIPSGSNFTQLIGSMANFLMGCTYLASLFEGSVDYKRNAVELMMTVPGSQGVNMYVMGDDNLFFTDRELDLGDMAAYLTRTFGVKVNADKTVSGYHSNPEFLHRVWTVNGCDRDQLEMCLNLIFPERKRNYMSYDPYDILFSLYYTFPLAFHASLDDMVQWFRNQYEHSGRKVTALVDIPISDLPGSAKVFSSESKRNYVHSFNNLILTRNE